MLNKLSIADPRVHMQASFPGSLALDSCIISKQLITQLEAAIEEAVSSGSWADALTNLPSTISLSDAATLATQAWAKQPKGGPSSHPAPHIDTCAGGELCNCQ
jgi:hypothetical protein